MKSLQLYTNAPIDSIKIRSALEPIFPGIIIEPTGTYWGKPPKSWQLFTYKTRIKDEEPTFTEEDQALIPIINPYYTDLDFHDETIAKKAVNAIWSVYPELYVYEDQLGWTGPAEEYIELDYSNFD